MASLDVLVASDPAWSCPTSVG